MENKTILEVENLSFSYGNDQNFVLNDISFKLKKGETLGILGPNGGGKSTLMKLMAGIIVPSSGTLKYNIEINNDLSFLPQSSDLNTTFPMTVIDFLKLTPNTTREKYVEALTMTGIEHKKKYLLQNLSGGELQRVLIARSILEKPKLLLLDEPTKGLDGQGIDLLLCVLKNLKEKTGTAIVLIDHNINEVVKFCDKILCLNKTFHWHNHSELLTKTVLEDIYHCEFEHLKLHEKDASSSASLDSNSIHNHQFCQHGPGHEHQQTNDRKFIFRPKTKNKSSNEPRE